ncbi:MAG: hypothetical protein CMD23_04015 [Flavobacteriales bacterium]|nr:hypothetical protein [Flavobacteriales bacterium]
MKKKLLYISIIILFPTFIIANDCNHIMDDNRMDIIIEQLNNKSDDTKRLNIIKTYLQRLCINTDQMLSIMKVFESKEIQQEFFTYSKEYITDLERYNKLNIN